MGLCQVPEGRRIFPRLTVEENLILGAFHRKDKEQIAKDLEYSYDLFPRLGERRRQEGGTTILIVEQNANIALQSATRGYVMETGEITLEDKASALLKNPKIRGAYLGE